MYVKWSEKGYRNIITLRFFIDKPSERPAVSIVSRLRYGVQRDWLNTRSKILALRDPLLAPLPLPKSFLTEDEKKVKVWQGDPEDYDEFGWNIKEPVPQEDSQRTVFKF